MHTEEEILAELQMVAEAEEAPRLETQHPELSFYALEEWKQALLVQGFWIPHHTNSCCYSSNQKDSHRGIWTEESIF